MNARLEKLAARRVDPSIKNMAMDRAIALEAFAKVNEDDAVKYAIGAMQPIDVDYTRNCFVEGDRVKNQLEKGLTVSADFAYQGSVTSDTHIKAHSDIDLLTLHPCFSTVEPPGVPEIPYAGKPVDELMELRRDAVRVLGGAFPEVKIDASPGKAISLSGGSLRRKVDVVVGNWWDTVEYQRLQIKENRGVKIFDSKTTSRIENKPFLHNKKIDERDKLFNGSLRKVIRLLKSVRYDSDHEINISSYDIAAIAYAMPDMYLWVEPGYDLKLVEASKIWLASLATNNTLRESLNVPNGMRRIFGPNGASREGVLSLFSEVNQLVDDINNGLSRSFQKLEEARVFF